MQEVRDKIDPRNYEITNYLGLEHFESNKGIVSKGHSSNLKSTKTRFKAGDVLYGKLRPYLNKHSVVNFDGICSTDILVYRNENETTSRYFNYYLDRKETISEAVKESKGINLPRVSAKSLAEFNIPVPQLPEQKQIVAKLDALFGHLEVLREKLDRIPELLKNFRQSVLTQAVTGKLTEEWREGKENLTSGNELILTALKEKEKTLDISITDDELHPFQIPDSWAFAKLETFGTLKRGKSKHRPRNDPKLFGGKYPFIQTGEVANAYWYIEEYKKTYSELGMEQSRLFPKGTLCITIAANIAETGILSFDSCFPDSVVGYNSYNDIYKEEFAMIYIKTIQKELEHYAPSTAQKNINLKLLNDVLFPVPNKEEIDEILNRVNSLMNLADRIESHYKSLKQKVDTLPQAILNKAFKGELVEREETTDS